MRAYGRWRKGTKVKTPPRNKYSDPYYGYYGYESYRHYKEDTRFKLKKRVLKQRKYVNGREVIKNRVVHEPINKEFHRKLLSEASKYYWHRSLNSFGSLKRVRPHWYIKNMVAPDLQIQCDIEDCFPSITDKMALKAMDKFTNLNKDRKGERIKKLILKAAFVSSPIGNYLAQGVNISPLVCNIVLTELDLKAEKMLENEMTMFRNQLSRLAEYAKEMYSIKEINKSIFDFVLKHTEQGPTIKYSRYVDNIALSFWNFPDSFHDLRIAKSLEKEIAVNPCTSVVQLHMRCRERIWHKLQKIIASMNLSLNKDKTKFRRKYGRKAIHFVGYTLNYKARAKRSYIEHLRCQLHNFKMYLRDCRDGKAVVIQNPSWLRRVKGKCVWVFTCDPMHRRINRCLKETIELERKVLGSNILGSLEKYLG